MVCPACPVVAAATATTALMGTAATTTAITLISSMATYTIAPLAAIPAIAVISWGSYRGHTTPIKATAISAIAAGAAVMWTHLQHSSDSKAQQTHEDIVKNSEDNSLALHPFLDITHLRPVSEISNHEWIEPQRCMVGRFNESDNLTAHHKGSHIFGKGGLDIIDSGNGKPDYIYFSMCSTEVVNNQTATIMYLEQHDVIRLFCTKQNLSASDITTQTIHEQQLTYLLVAGKFKPTAIALEGMSASSPLIEFNTKFDLDGCNAQFSHNNVVEV